jgi:hypothetical protein
MNDGKHSGGERRDPRGDTGLPPPGRPQQAPLTTTSDRACASGTLVADGDRWLLMMTHGRSILLDVAPLDPSLTHQAVSIAGRMRVPSDARRDAALGVERLVRHEEIAQRAYAIYQLDRGGSPSDHWLRAERDLLALSSAGDRPRNVRTTAATGAAARPRNGLVR